jgi:hypothetical protein
MTLTPWQRASILAASNYLKEIARVGQNFQAQALSTGLLEVLEPSRRRRERKPAASGGRASGGGQTDGGSRSR